MTAAPPLSLTDLRLLNEAKAGNPKAVHGLWVRVASSCWSVLAPLVHRKVGLEHMVALRKSLDGDLRGLDGVDWRAPVYERLWHLVWDSLQLPPMVGIDRGSWPKPDVDVLLGGAPRADEARAKIRAALATAPKELQVIHLFDLFTTCSASQIARFAEVDEGVVREARAAVTYHLVLATREGA